VAFNQNYAGTEKGQTDFALYSQVITGSAPSVVPLTYNSAIYQINNNSSTTSFRLPAVTSGVTTVGTFFIVNNNGGASATIANVSAVTLHTCAVGSTVKAILLDNTTAPDGTWEMTSELPNTVNWGTANATYNGNFSLTGTHDLSVSSTGSVVSNTLSSLASTKLTLNTTNGTVELQNNGAKTGDILYNSATFPLQIISTAGLSLDAGAGRNTHISSGQDTAGSVINLITGTITRAQVTDGGILCNSYSNLGDVNVNITAFSSGNNPSIIFNSRSSNSSTALGRWGLLNSAGWQFEDGNSVSSTLTCGVNSTGFYLPNAGFFLTGARFNATQGGSRYAVGDIVIFNNASGTLNSPQQFQIRSGNSLKIWRNDELNSWETYISNTSQYVIRQNGGNDYFLNGGQVGAVWNYNSDERLKENIQPAPSYLETVLSIPVKTFNYKKQPETNCVGFIAQDIQKLPQLLDIVCNSTTSAPDGTPYLALGDGKFMPYLIKAFQEQHAKITSLEAQLASLKATVDALVAQKEILVV
jgi:hypothetical protein